MKITILTTVYDGKTKIQTSESLQKNDIRIEMLANCKNLSTTYNILDCVFDYEGSQTKFGFRVTKTIVQHKITKHITVQQISYK